MSDSTADLRTVAAAQEGLEAAWLAWHAGAEAPPWQDFLPGPGQPCTPERGQPAQRVHQPRGLSCVRCGRRSPP
jgi:hypothetical protein